MSGLCFCQEPCGQAWCPSRVERVGESTTNTYCGDCGAEYFGTVQEALEADWIMMSDHPVADVLCPDCFDANANFESDSATGYEAPEWSKNEDPTAT